jgi:hypothetical protein
MIRSREQCLQFCVYRMRTVRFPMRHGTINLFKFEYIVTVTRVRPLDDPLLNRKTSISISNLCRFSLFMLELRVDVLRTMWREETY